jgi:hypothetical protein
MDTRNVRKLLSIAAVVVVLLATSGVVSRPSQLENGNVVYSLESPSFLSVAHADEQAILSVIGDEAGIAAYFHSAALPDIESVEAAFRTIEQETEDYIIGSVEVLNYPESEDVHVYVHREGWFLAYYLAADPVGKIFDWRAYHDSGRTLLTTKLENTLIKVAGYAVVSYPGCTYYDFRYPNATDLILIADWVVDGSDSFEVDLPGPFTYYERSWSLGNNNGAYIQASYKLDGVTIKSQSGGWRTDQGILTASQLLPEQLHTIAISASSTYGYTGCYTFGGLALIYKVP